MENFVPVVVIKELSETDKILTALKNNGINCAEITFRTACAKEAIEYARRFSAWPNVVITDDTFTYIPGLGEMIYMNGEIVKRCCDGEYLTPSRSVYDAARTTISYTVRRLYHMVPTSTGKPSQVKFFTKIGLTIQRLQYDCQMEAERMDEPCRVL